MPQVIAPNADGTLVGPWTNEAAGTTNLTTTYSDTGLASNVRYNYRVRAVL